MLSCEYCETFHNTYSEEHLRTARGDRTPNLKIELILFKNRRWEERTPEEFMFNINAYQMIFISGEVESGTNWY